MSDVSERIAAALEAARAQHDPNEADRLRVKASLDRSVLNLSSAIVHESRADAGTVSQASTAALGGSKVWLAAVLLMAGVGSWALMTASGPRTGRYESKSSASRDVPSSAGTMQTAPIATPLFATDGPAVSPRPEQKDVAVAPRATAVQRPVESARVEVASVRPGSSRHGRATSPPPVSATRHDTEQPAAAEPEASPTLSPTSTVAPRSATAAPRSAPDAQAELGLIRGALAALNQAQPGQALALLSQHASLYPDGVFATERLGLRVLSLCAAKQRVQGLRERAQFLRQHADHPSADRVRAACGGADAP